MSEDDLGLSGEGARGLRRGCDPAGNVPCPRAAAREPWAPSGALACATPAMREYQPVASRGDSLLRRIEHDLLTGQPLRTLLQQCLLLAGRSGSDELANWARRELHGYEGVEDELPAYREIHPALYLDAIVGLRQITGQEVSSHMLPEFTRERFEAGLSLTQPIGEIEGWLDSGALDGVKIRPGLGADLVALMNSSNRDEMQTITALYWWVNGGTLRGVLDRVRTTLTDLVAVLLASVPTNGADPTGDQVGHAVNVAVYGRVSSIRIASNHAGGNIQPANSGDPPWWRSWLVLVGLVSVVAAVVTLILSLR